LKHHSLPEIFWHNFYSEHWEKHPAVFKNLFDPPFVSPNELFDAIVGMPSRTPADRFWASRQIPPRRRDDFQIVPIDQHGPRAQDQSLAGFFTRVRQQIGDLPIGLNIHKLERSRPELWFKFREFVYRLNRITRELPSGRWDIDTFLGTYRTSPLGIHRDNASVFAIGVLGHRTYYTWPADYFKPEESALTKLDTTSIQAHLDQAIIMELEPGDLVYWPSSNWHFVASDGLPSAVISVSAYFGKNLSEIIGNQIRGIIAEQLAEKDFNRVYTLNEELTDPPQQLTSALQLAEKAVKNGHIGDVLERFWLTMCSADGLQPVPPDESARLELHDIISADPRFPILWKQTATDTLWIAANGRSFAATHASSEVIIEMLTRLNTGQMAVVEQLLTKYAQGNISAEVIMGTLNSLHRFRAFQKR